MHIIFGNCKNFDEIKEKYVVLQLETFEIAGNNQTAYCIVDPASVPPEEMADMKRLTDLHQAVIEAWDKEDYATVLFGMPHLIGKFGGELDSFYSNLKERITNCADGIS